MKTDISKNVCFLLSTGETICKKKKRLFEKKNIL